MDEGKSVMRRDARFNIVPQTSKINSWGPWEEGEEQGRAGPSREWGEIGGDGRKWVEKLQTDTSERSHTR